MRIVNYRTFWITVVVLVTGMVCSYAWSTSQIALTASAAQNSLGNDSSLQELTTEMRQLRYVIQQGNWEQLQAMIVLEKLRSQSEMIRKLKTDLEEVRLPKNEIELQKLEDERESKRLKMLEMKIKAETDEQSRSSLEADYEEAKYDLARRAIQRTFQSEREVQLEASLDSENRILEELTQELNKIEKSIKMKFTQLKERVEIKK